MYLPHKCSEAGPLTVSLLVYIFWPPLHENAGTQTRSDTAVAVQATWEAEGRNAHLCARRGKCRASLQAPPAAAAAGCPPTCSLHTAARSASCPPGSLAPH